MPVSTGRLLSRVRKASSPPADAPMPTTGTIASVFFELLCFRDGLGTNFFFAAAFFIAGRFLGADFFPVDAESEAPDGRPGDRGSAEREAFFLLTSGVSYVTFRPPGTNIFFAYPHQADVAESHEHPASRHGTP